MYHVHKNQMRANTAGTGRRGFVTVFKHFAERGFEFIQFPIIVHAAHLPVTQKDCISHTDMDRIPNHLIGETAPTQSNRSLWWHIVAAKPQAYIDFAVDVLYAAGLRETWVAEYLQKSGKLTDNLPGTEIIAVEAHYRAIWGGI